MLLDARKSGSYRQVPLAQGIEQHPGSTLCTEMTEYTEEMLLGSPVENGGEDAANDVDQCTSQRVSTSAVLKKCEQWRDISKNLAYIAI
ncbi:unnamed protein product [Nippostrongylus brasiliensis]|uniref:Uncharacterized protein n=1 Tax=Nippostrongylus brasiliensis TaxID=27835 RepID=A0A0N4XY44_NIPBR|nr:unnamed protein product [Nippostrongylus brasiliensis]